MKPKDCIRNPPAFQEYAADMLANRNFRVMSLEERGLLMTMRYECWVNYSVPANIDDLAKTLGLNERDLSEALTHRVSHFFTEVEKNYVCGELDAYRKKLLSGREAMSKGGRHGGLNTQAKYKHNQATPEATLKPVSRVKYNGEENSKNESSGRSDKNYEEIDSWVKKYDQHS